MPVPKQNRDKHNPKPVSQFRSPSDVGCARKKVSSLRDFFTERGKRPDKQQSKKRDLCISANLIRQCWRGRRWPEKPRNPLADELCQEDPHASRNHSGQAVAPP